MQQAQTVSNEAAVGHAAGADHQPHVTPLKAYLGVYAALLGLTALTVGVSYLDFGEWNTVVALLVASTKALLVAAVFMHLALEKKRFNAVVALVSVFFLVVLIAFTLFDTGFRGIAERVEGERSRDYTAPFAKGKPDPKVDGR